MNYFKLIAFILLSIIKLSSTKATISSSYMCFFLSAKILNLPKVAQHYVKNLLNSDKHKKYDSIVEDIIKEKIKNGKKGKR